MRPPLTLRELARSRNTGRLVVIVIATLLFAGGLVYISNRIRHVINGPRPITLAELVSMDSDAIGGWFDVAIDVPPRHLLKTTTKGRGRTSVTNHFALIRDFTAANKTIIVQAELDELPTTLLAWAFEFDQNGEYYRRARSQLDRWTAGMSRQVPISPVLLRPSHSVEVERSIMGSAIAIIALVLVITGWRTARGLANYLRVPPIARLRRSVRAPQGLPSLVAEIDRELAGLDPKARRTGPIILPSWLINVTPTTFTVMSASDVVQVMPVIVRTKLYYVIPISKRHEVRVRSRTGDKLALPMRENKIPEVLTVLHHWAPWAVIGPASISDTELVATVDKRREEFLAARGAQPGRWS